MRIMMVVRPAELAAALGCSERTLRRMWERGDLPEPARLTPRMLVWPVAVVNQWLGERGLGEWVPGPVEADRVEA